MERPLARRGIRPRCRADRPFPPARPRSQGTVDPPNPGSNFEGSDDPLDLSFKGMTNDPLGLDPRGSRYISVSRTGILWDLGLRGPATLSTSVSRCWQWPDRRASTRSSTAGATTASAANCWPASDSGCSVGEHHPGGLRGAAAGWQSYQPRR